MREPAAGAGLRSRDAWTAFWQEPGQSRCAAGAGIWQALSLHWAQVAASLQHGARVLDLGCGAGAVAHELLAARADLQLTGVDFARIPFTLRAHVELLSETPMECLPFAERSFGAAVSQFGFEYSRISESAAELARVLAPGARLSMLVHHASSGIVGHNRARLEALAAFLDPAMKSAFCSADTRSFHAQLAALVAEHPGDALVAELARSLPSRLARAQRERQAIWKAIEDALAPECCLASSLNDACLTPEAIGPWLAPLQSICSIEPPCVLRDGDGSPIAWIVQGTRSA
jgi:ubiquinone/menaquinone biosynthesis C-methylase UbiE